MAGSPDSLRHFGIGAGAVLILAMSIWATPGDELVPRPYYLARYPHGTKRFFQRNRNPHKYPRYLWSRQRDMRVCYTEEGKRCIFPFKFGGKTYYRCTSEDASRPWCATKVNSNLGHTEWGYCSNDAGCFPSYGWFPPYARYPYPVTG